MQDASFATERRVMPFETDRPRHYRPREAALANFRRNRLDTVIGAPGRKIRNRPGMDPRHLTMLRRLACTVCPEHRATDPHHLKSGPCVRERGVGMKATDRWIPLCWLHHDELERLGSRRERDWFLERGIDPHLLAQALWFARGDYEKMLRVLTAHKQQAIQVLNAMRRQS
jgi:hypothetical protein